MIAYQMTHKMHGVGAGVGAGVSGGTALQARTPARRDLGRQRKARRAGVKDQNTPQQCQKSQKCFQSLIYVQ